jgi:hypothetical protein
MKRPILILVIMGLLVGGCAGGGPSAEEVELERKITQLEEKVAELSQSPAAAPAPTPTPTVQ